MVMSPTLNRKVGCSRPTMIRDCCLSVRQHYSVLKKNRFVVMSCTARMLVLSLVDKRSYIILNKGATPKTVSENLLYMRSLFEISHSKKVY